MEKKYAAAIFPLHIDYLSFDWAAVTKCLASLIVRQKPCQIIMHCYHVVTPFIGALSQSINHSITSWKTGLRLSTKQTLLISCAISPGLTRPRRLCQRRGGRGRGGRRCRSPGARGWTRPLVAQAFKRFYPYFVHLQRYFIKNLDLDMA